MEEETLKQIEDLEELYTKNIILELLNKKETENEDTTNWKYTRVIRKRRRY